jgi:hypothetical protein
MDETIVTINGTNIVISLEKAGLFATTTEPERSALIEGILREIKKVNLTTELLYKVLIEYILCEAKTNNVFSDFCGYKLKCAFNDGYYYYKITKNTKNTAVSLQPHKYKKMFQICNEIINSLKFIFIGKNSTVYKLYTFNVENIVTNSAGIAPLSKSERGMLVSDYGSLKSFVRLAHDTNDHLVVFENYPTQKLLFIEEDFENSGILNYFANTGLIRSTAQLFLNEVALNAEDEKVRIQDKINNLDDTPANKKSRTEDHTALVDKIKQEEGKYKDAYTILLTEINKILSFADPDQTNPLLVQNDCSATFTYTDKSSRNEQLIIISFTFGSMYSVYGIDSQKIRSYILPLKNTGYGGLYGRVDNVTASEYKWAVDFNVLDNKSNELFKGKSREDIIQQIVTTFDLLKDNYIEYCKDVNVIPEKNGFKYEKTTDGYILCNTHIGKLPVYYYRKVQLTKIDDPDTMKVVKTPNINSGSFRNSPSTTTSGYLFEEKDGNLPYGSIGINLPISFSIKDNRIKIKDIKKDFPSLKNKFNYLKRNNKPRAKGGQNGIMKKSLSKKINPIIDVQFSNKWNGGATDFCNLIYAEFNTKVNPTNESPKSQWQTLKLSSPKALLPVNQEWCHLMGHGDGGDETSENLVGGSYHCNTEQLAIESAQRHFTHKSGSAKNYILKVTAYLFKSSGSMVDNATGNYINLNQLKNIKNIRTKDSEKFGKEEIFKKLVEEQNLLLGSSPFAQFIHYKIYEVDKSVKNTEDLISNTNLIKVFDHYFEAQSEFFDKNQANLLYANVMLALGETKFEKLSPSSK